MVLAGVLLESLEGKMDADLQQKEQGVWQGLQEAHQE